MPLKLVLLGGAGAHLVADEIAKSQTPLILTRNRGAPDTYEKRNALSGPPLTQSPVAVLTKAGVLVALSIAGEGSKFSQPECNNLQSRLLYTLLTTLFPLLITNTI